MKPVAPAGSAAGQYALADPGRDYLVYSADGGRVRLNLSADPGSYVARRVNLRTGRCEAAGETVSGGRVVELEPPGGGAWAVWVTRGP
jgi:hypothetical protein